MGPGAAGTAGPGLGEGRTPLVELRPGVWVKDESRNPTWSHKDRLNRCAVSAAVGTGAVGVVVASSGNHGASAAAFAARAGLAGMDRLGPVDGPVVCISTSGGFKDPVRKTAATDLATSVEWPEVQRTLKDAGLMF